jgi:hypothetical protein
VITAPKIRQIVTYPLLIERLRGAYSEFSSFAIPPTTRHTIVTSGSQQQRQSASPSLLLMPAWCTTPKRPYLLVKSVTVFPENGSKGLPAVAGTYVLSSLETGKFLLPSRRIRSLALDPPRVLQNRHLSRKLAFNCKDNIAIAIACAFSKQMHSPVPSSPVILGSNHSRKVRYETEFKQRVSNEWKHIRTRFRNTFETE